MKVEHPFAAHMTKEQPAVTAQPTPVYEVHPAEDDAFLIAQMEAAAKSFQPPTVTPGIPQMREDPIVKKAMEKKNTLEKLLFFKKDHTVEVSIGGVTFKIKLLNSNDQAHIIKLMQQHAATEPYKLSLMTLAASVLTANDVPLEDFYDGAEPVDNPVIKKYIEINKWHTPITTALMNAYTKFQKEVEEGYTKDFLVK